MTSNPGDLELISGTISDMQRSRRTRDFLASEMGETHATTLAAAATGMSGLASLSSSLDTRETADYVQFTLDGRAIHGWLWYCPMRDGDDVRIAAERSSLGWRVFGIWRPADNYVAVYPHCYRGTQAYKRNEIRMWAWIVGVIHLITFLMMAVITLINTPSSEWPRMLGAIVGYMPISVTLFGLLAWRAMRKGMAFPQLANRIFTCFQWQHPSDVNLRHMSRIGRKVTATGDYGNLYYRYDTSQTR